MDVLDLFGTLGLDTSGYYGALDNAMRAMSDAQAAMSNTGRSSDDLGKDIDELTKEYHEAQAEVERLTEAYKESVARTGEASEESRDLAGQLADAKGKAAGLLDAIGEGSGLTDIFSTAIGGLVTKLAAAAAAFVSVQKAMAFMKDAVGTAMTFEQSMSQVVATMGYSVADLNDETSEAAQTYEKLSDFAQKMGASTMFTAAEAAQALNFMALAGYDAQKSMDMLPNVLSLAAAGGMDLATAAEMVTNTSNALGLDMQGTTDLVNEMAMAASKSGTTVSQLGDAMLTVGGTAKMMKGGTTEISTALGILADAGVKASEGGTALRNILLSLSSPTGDAEKYMEQLGLQVYDTEGNMRSLQDIFLEMSAAMQGMTQQQQTEIISSMFNKRDLKSVNALLGTSVERWEQLTGAIQSADGAAAEMADVQMNNLSGALKYFDSAMEGFKIAVGNSFLPILSEFVGFGTTAMQSFTDAFKDEGVAGLIEAAAQAIGDFAVQFTDPEKIKAVVRAGADLVAGLIDGLVRAIPKILDAIPTLTGNLVAGILGAGPQISQAGFELFKNLVKSLPEVIRSMHAVLPNFVLQVAAGILNAASMMAEAGFELFMSLIEDLPEIIENLITAIPQIIAGLTTSIGDNIDKVIEAGVRLGVALAEGLLKAIPEIIKAIPKIIVAIGEGIDNSMHLLFSKGEESAEQIEEGVETKLEADSEDLGEKIVNSVSDGVDASAPETEKIGEKIAWKIGGGIKKSAGTIAGAINDTLKSVGEKALAFDAAARGKIVTASTFGANGGSGYVIPFELTGSAFDDAAREVAKAAEKAAKADEKVTETVKAVDKTIQEAEKIVLPSIEEVITGMNQTAQDIIKGKVGVMAGFDDSTFKVDGGVDYDEFARQWAAESGQDVRAVRTLAPQLAEAMIAEYKAKEAETKSEDETVRILAENYIAQIPEAMKEAMNGISVYLDNRKVGNLVTGYQRNMAVAMG